MTRSVVARLWNRIGGPILLRQGRVGRLTTIGRRTGRPRLAYVGIVPLDGGRYLIGAGGPGRSWAANLRANPTCTLETRDGSGRFRARLLAQDERAAAAAAMAARMGPMARRASWADIFELVPEPGSPPPVGAGPEEPGAPRSPSEPQP